MVENRRIKLTATIAALRALSARNPRQDSKTSWALGFASAGFPVTKEPTGLFRTDGKRPDGLTVVPWQSGKALCWDVTVTCPLADSYLAGAAHEVASAAELAAARKDDKIRH